jgi:hypothetical protein
MLFEHHESDIHALSFGTGDASVAEVRFALRGAPFAMAHECNGSGQ